MFTSSKDNVNKHGNMVPYTNCVFWFRAMLTSNCPVRLETVRTAGWLTGWLASWLAG
jgi:hypothetical protein